MKLPPGSPRRSAFTLLELLVVISIILVLSGTLLSVFSTVQGRAADTKCGSNLKQLGAAFILFAGEHDNQLPGSYDTRDKAVGIDALAYQGSWLSGSTAQSDETINAPRKGTIFPYVNNEKVYRCPALAFTKKGDQKGSNGSFDYAFFCRLAGARLQNIPGTAVLRNNTDSTPMLIEESPAVSLNNSQRNIESTFDLSDQAALTHRNGCNYVATDGSLHRVQPPDKNKPYTAQEWAVDLGGHNYLNLGKPNVAAYGDWSQNGDVSSSPP